MTAALHMPMMLADTVLPPIVVLPLAFVTMLVVAAHVMSVQMSDMPLMRKRLRIANGLMMMFVAAALAYALGVANVVTDARANPGGARGFVIVWMVIVALLSIVVVLAVVDALSTLGMGYRQHRTLRREMREELARDAAARHTDSEKPSRG